MAEGCIMSITDMKFVNYFYTDDLPKCFFLFCFFIPAGARTNRREAVVIEKSRVVYTASGDNLFFYDCEAPRSSSRHVPVHEQHT